MGREILNQRQVDFLKAIQHSSDFFQELYLTGGTALAAFYLNHRQSEDLDFFSEKEIEPLAVETFLKLWKKKLGFERFEFQRSFNRNLFFLHFSDNGILKTEFTYFPFTRLEIGMQEGNLYIDSLRDIAVNKVFTIAQQIRARDFVDLFYIIKREHWEFKKLIQDAQAKFETHIDLIQLGAQLIKVVELKDFPRMTIPFDVDEFHSFFVELALALKKEVLS